MAEYLYSASVKLLLDDGTDAQGNPKYANVNYPRIDKNGYDSSKILALASALGPVLNKSVEEVQARKTFELSN